MKEKLFQFLFPKQAALMKKIHDSLADMMTLNDELKEEVTKRSDIGYLIDKILGGTVIDFANANSAGKPPHYLEGLSTEERKVWIANLTLLHQNKYLEAVVSYLVNLFGNNSLRKADPEAIKNGQIAIVAMDVLNQALVAAESEFIEQKKAVESFDPLAPLPE